MGAGHRWRPNSRYGNRRDRILGLRATVVATQTESGLQRTVTSGADGGYSLPSLPVGPYTLKVTAAGFSAYDQSGIVVQVGNELRVDVKLQVGGVAQTVQVTAAASMVQTEDQSISRSSTGSARFMCL